MRKLDIKEIDNKYYYENNDLGYVFNGGLNTFKVWSPIADEMYLCLYENYSDAEGKKYPMQKGDKGIWQISLEGNLENKFYTFISLIEGVKREAVDPYARAVSVNGEKGAIIDLNKSNPDGWINHKVPKRLYGTDSIIYEVSVRDLTSDNESGINNKAKFLGLSEENTTGPQGVKTGLSHIKELGVTHVQLLPIFDFYTIDERAPYNSEKYNWGYDPFNYNVPEGSYSTDPYNPTTRIKELKQAIKSLHESGISVIMDVVYNHVYDVNKSCFNKLVPGYYFRYNNNGTLANESMCGNGIASENAMVRKYIVDSIIYWANEYKIDGFRFDLMGLLDVKTMNTIREELDKIDPNIIMLGEGWNMGSILKYEDKATQGNAYKLKNIAFFNDVIRDALRGNPFSYNVRGFLSGEYNKEYDVKKGIVGGIKYSNFIQLWGDVSPNQVVNYIECHDNHTLYDKLNLTIKDSNDLKYMSRLGTSIILLSQGIPFLDLGQDFLRTKNGVQNSYNSPDSINKINWRRKLDNIDTFNYVKGLITLRKAKSVFRMKTVEEIKNKLMFINTPSRSVGYKLLDDVNGNIIVIHNANKNGIEIYLGYYGRFNVLVNKEKSGVEVIKVVEGDKLFVDSLSTLVVEEIR